MIDQSGKYVLMKLTRGYKLRGIDNASFKAARNFILAHPKHTSQATIRHIANSQHATYLTAVNPPPNDQYTRHVNWVAEDNDLILARKLAAFKSVTCWGHRGIKDIVYELIINERLYMMYDNTRDNVLRKT
jgi:hypothetical protein